MIQAGIRHSSGVMSDLARLTKRLASLMSNPPVVLPVTVAGHEILILKIFTCIEYIKKQSSSFILVPILSNYSL